MEICPYCATPILGKIWTEIRWQDSGEKEYCPECFKRIDNYGKTEASASLDNRESIVLPEQEVRVCTSTGIGIGDNK